MEHTVTAVRRKETGSAANRKLRRQDKVPGIVYGHGDPRMISVDHAALSKDLSHEAFHSSILNLEIEGEKVPVLLREFQSHPVSDRILHIDFQAVAEDAEISMTVPVHFVNAESSPGVKLDHGVFSVIEAELEINCLPRDLPEHISVDVGHLEINHNIHLSEVTPPTGVTFAALERGENPSIASILVPQKEEEVVEAVETTEVGEQPETEEEGKADEA